MTTRFAPIAEDTERGWLDNASNSVIAEAVSPYGGALPLVFGFRPDPGSCPPDARGWGSAMNGGSAGVRHRGGGAALSVGLHVSALLVLISWTAAPGVPVRVARSTTSLTFVHTVPAAVLYRQPHAGPGPATVRLPTHVAPAAARAPESVEPPAQVPRITTPIASKEIASRAIERADNVAIPSLQPAPIDRRPASPGEPSVGLFDAREAGAARRQGEQAQVRLAGFDATAPRMDSPANEIHQGGFDVRPSPTPAAVEARHDPIELPVEITFKPTPDYTEEARTLKVEGVVRLDVIFAASGELRVMRVLDGLGHGLDEAAARAARQIRFRPARSRGLPVDQRTTLRITFRVS